MFDVRFLRNPYFEAELREKTGNDSEVVSFLFAQPETEEFLDRLEAFLDYLLPHYAKEGKSNLTIGIGCTGGRHRSVAISNHLGKRLGVTHQQVRVSHRDVEND